MSNSSTDVFEFSSKWMFIRNLLGPPSHYLLLSLMDIPSLFMCQMQSCQLECGRGMRVENDIPAKLSSRLLFTARSLSFRICQRFWNLRDVRTCGKACWNTGVPTPSCWFTLIYLISEALQWWHPFIVMIVMHQESLLLFECCFVQTF